MRYAVIKNGVVDNVIIAQSVDDYPSLQLVQSDTAETGDLYSGGTFTKQTIVVVPFEVSPAGFRLALNQLNLRSLVESAVAVSDQNTKDMWEYSRSIQRANPLLIAMANQLGITPTQLDGVFVVAGQFA